MPGLEGSTLGRFKVLKPIGRGGMGEVFLAEDTTLGRKVALKILPADLAGHPERRARFDNEARAIASLNHPNIVTVHSIEHESDVHFITMEYVTGRTLKELVPAGGMPEARLLQIAMPLVEAVHAAHERGITHRDLKPANVMVGDDGRVKVLDFGLAKLTAGGSGHEAETVASPEAVQTEAGRLLGTIAYMSPEQVEGKVVDHRADIFALGVMMHEMVTGARPFSGDTNAALMSAILRDSPPLVSDVNPRLQPGLARIVRRCLAKDPSRRYQTALDLRNDLDEMREATLAGTSGIRPDAPQATRSARPRWIAPVAGAAALAAAVAGYFWLSGGEAPAGDSLANLTFSQVTLDPGEEVFPSLSPDGRMIVYAASSGGAWRILLKRVAGQNPIALSDRAGADDTQPAFSPDGERIAFRSERDGGGIFVMGATGESVQRITSRGFHPAWAPDGREIVYGTQSVTDPSLRFTTSELWAIDVGTGQERLLSPGDAVQPSFSPNGHRIAYWGRSTGAGPGDIWTIPVSGGEPVAVTDDAGIDWNPVWSPDGRFIYFSSNRGGSMNLWRVEVDERSGRTVRAPEPVTSAGGSSNQHVTFSADGRHMAYVSATQTTNLQRLAFDPASGTVSGTAAWITQGSRTAAQPHPSPDGLRVAFNSGGAQEDLLVVNADGTGLTQLTNDAARDRAARWSPGGDRIAFYSDRTGQLELWSVGRDGRDLRQLTRSPGAHYPVWSPDGRRMAFSTHLPNGAYVFDLESPWEAQTPQALPALPDPTQSFEVWSWSPDGRRLAGQKHLADLSHAGIGVHALGSDTIDWMTDAGEWPVWLGDGRRLLFSNQGSLLLLDTATREARTVLTLAQNNLGSVGLSADDRSIYLTFVAREADVWVMSRPGSPVR